MKAQFDHASQEKNNKKRSTENAGISMPSTILVHAKLEMTNPGDSDEQEADEVAESIVNDGKIARAVSTGHSGSGIALPSQFGSQLASFQGQGSRLYGDLKSQMETGFGRDFSSVRLHTDNAAAEMSSSISARAFTYGNDIYFNRGQFNPDTHDGQQLLAHELTHVAQENGKLSRSYQLKPERAEPVPPFLMNSLLTPSELLLLNMLTYLPNEVRKEFEGAGALGSIIHRIQSKYTLGELQDSTISTNDWMNVFLAIKSNVRLNSIRVGDKKEDRLGGYYMLFVCDATKEIIVAFRGTSPDEWTDNFIGGSYTDKPGTIKPGTNPDKRSVITKQQEVALNIYNEMLDKIQHENTINPESGKDTDNPSTNGYTITVTGHSKGGNKAKFVTLMNDNEVHSIGRCVSFDGQGFSDEFVDRYHDRIKEREDLITNYNARKDFVNILLNNVGRTHFLNARNFSTDSFKENHSPEVMLDFKRTSDGRMLANLADEGYQDPGMIEIDKFFNNFLRSFNNIKDEDFVLKTGILSFLGEAIQYYFMTDDLKETIYYATRDPSKKVPFIYFCLYLIDYYDANEAFREVLKQIIGPVRTPGLITALKTTSYRFRWRAYCEQFLNYHYYNPSSTDGNDIEI